MRTLGQEALWGREGASQKTGSVVRVSGFCQQSAGSTGWSGCLSTKPAARSGWPGHGPFRFSLRLNHSVQRRQGLKERLGRAEKAFLQPHIVLGMSGCESRESILGEMDMCAEQGLASSSPGWEISARLCVCLQSAVPPRL